MTMHTETNSFPLIHLDETNSTNRYLTQLCDRQQVAEYTTVCADYQTAGKGQRGNTWESERGKNLMFSLVLYPTFLQPQRQFILSQLTALAVRDTLTRWAGDIRIKWPNDIYWRDKKIGGILIENDLSGTHIARSIIGVGLNINQTEFKGGAPNPVSLLQVCGIHCKRKHVLERILKHFESYYRMLERGEVETIREHYRKALFRRRDFHPYRDADGVFNARLHHVEDSGLIILEDTEGRLRPYAFKEVEFVL